MSLGRNQGLDHEAEVPLGPVVPGRRGPPVPLLAIGAVALATVSFAAGYSAAGPP